MSDQKDKFCRGYVDKIFGQYDKDGSNVLERRQLKMWIQDSKKKAPLHKKIIEKQFSQLVANADSNGDGKVDRWELYEYCLKSYVD